MHRNLRRSAVVITGGAVALGLGIAPTEASAGSATPTAVAATSTDDMSWSTASAKLRTRRSSDRYPGSAGITFSDPAARAALGERLGSAVTRVGPAPAALEARAMDGRITVQQGSRTVSVDLSSGAVVTEVAAGSGMYAAWAPAGDRLLSQVTGSDGGRRTVLTDEDGSGAATVWTAMPGGPYQYDQQRTWSPFGGHVLLSSAERGEALKAPTNTRTHTKRGFGTLPSPEWEDTLASQSPVINSYGDLSLSVWTDTSVQPPVDRVTIGDPRLAIRARTGMFNTWNPVNLRFTAPRIGQPALGLAPGGDTAALSHDVLALPAVVDGDAVLLVDHADGQEMAVAADLGAVCDGTQVAFAPSHSRLAYLKAVGPEGDPCSATELWELSAVDGRYDGGTSRKVASSGGTPFTNLSWKAETAPAFAGRIFGADRIETAAATSSAFHAAASAPVVVLVNSTAFPDALAATPLAARRNGTLLMTTGGGLDPRTRDELVRVASPEAEVFLIGGEGVLSAPVADEVADLGYTVTRLSGPSRFETAVAVAEELSPSDDAYDSGHILLADGTNFPDALVAGAAAAKANDSGVVVLTNGDRLPAATDRYLRAALSREGTTSLSMVGGPAVRATSSIAFYNDYATCPRCYHLAGADRYQTAYKVLQHFEEPMPYVGIVDGRNWPDAISGGVAMANAGGSLLLSNGTTLSTPMRTWLETTRSSTDTVIAFGGPAVVPDQAVLFAQDLSGGQSPVWGLDRP